MSYIVWEECLEFVHWLSSENVQSTLQTWHHCSLGGDCGQTFRGIIPLQQYGKSSSRDQCPDSAQVSVPDWLSSQSHIEKDGVNTKHSQIKFTLQSLGELYVSCFKKAHCMFFLFLTFSQMAMLQSSLHPFCLFVFWSKAKIKRQNKTRNTKKYLCHHDNTKLTHLSKTWSLREDSLKREMETSYLPLFWLGSCGKVG